MCFSGFNSSQEQAEHFFKFEKTVIPLLFLFNLRILFLKLLKFKIRNIVRPLKNRAIQRLFDALNRPTFCSKLVRLFKG